MKPSQEIYDAAIKVAAFLREASLEPMSSDEEIKAWPLWIDFYGDGDIYCGDIDCPLQAENSKILEAGDFTLAELYDAVDEHIARRKEREKHTPDESNAD